MTNYNYLKRNLFHFDKFWLNINFSFIKKIKVLYIITKNGSLPGKKIIIEILSEIKAINVHLPS